MIRFLLECKRLFEKYSKDEMSVYAAQASFFIILASIPFLMLLLSLIQATPLVNESDLLSLVVQMVPDTLDGLVVYVLDSLHSDSPMALLSATAIAALWSSSRGMLSIERGLTGSGAQRSRETISSAGSSAPDIQSFFPSVSFVHGAPGVRGADPETGLGLDPFDVHL